MVIHACIEALLAELVGAICRHRHDNGVGPLALLLVLADSLRHLNPAEIRQADIKQDVGWAAFLLLVKRLLARLCHHVINLQFIEKSGDDLLVHRVFFDHQY